VGVAAPSPLLLPRSLKRLRYGGGKGRTLWGGRGWRRQKEGVESATAGVVAEARGKVVAEAREKVMAEEETTDEAAWDAPLIPASPIYEQFIGEKTISVISTSFQCTSNY